MHAHKNFIFCPCQNQLIMTLQFVQAWCRLQRHVNIHRHVIRLVYWFKVLTDQQGLCRFFRKHKIVKNLKTATVKKVIIHLSNLLKCFFRKCHYVFFLVKKWKVPYPNTILQFHNCWLSRVLDIQDHTFFHWLWMEKSVDLLLSEFFLCCDLSVIMCSSKGKGFRFPPV